VCGYVRADSLNVYAGTGVLVGSTPAAATSPASAPV